MREARRAEVSVVARDQDGDPGGLRLGDQQPSAIVSRKVAEATVSVHQQTGRGLPGHLQSRVGIEGAVAQQPYVRRQLTGPVTDHAAQVILRQQVC